MKKADVKIGSTYTAKVSDKLTSVRIDEEHPSGGWNATNLATKKKVRIKSAQRLRGPAGKNAPKPLKDAAAEKARKEAIKSIDENLKDDGKAATTPARRKGKKKATTGTTKRKNATRAKKGDAKAAPKRRGILDVAAEIIAKSKEPMTAKAMVDHAIEKGMWTTSGATPQATLYAAIIREIAAKGRDARFVKVDRGLFKAKGA